MSDQISDIYGSSSNWLKAADLQNGKPVVTISNAEVRENTYNGETKKQIVLSFEGKEKLLGLNVTNARRIADLLGTTDFHEWIGFSIKLYVDKTEVEGRTVDCIRIFPELPAQVTEKAKAAVASSSNDDDIPF